MRMPMMPMTTRSSTRVKARVRFMMVLKLAGCYPSGLKNRNQFFGGQCLNTEPNESVAVASNNVVCSGMNRRVCLNGVFEIFSIRSDRCVDDSQVQGQRPKHVAHPSNCRH